MHCTCSYSNVVDLVQRPGPSGWSPRLRFPVTRCVTHAGSTSPIPRRTSGAHGAVIAKLVQLHKERGQSGTIAKVGMKGRGTERWSDGSSLSFAFFLPCANGSSSLLCLSGRAEEGGDARPRVWYTSRSKAAPKGDASVVVLTRSIS